MNGKKKIQLFLPLPSLHKSKTQKEKSKLNCLLFDSSIFQTRHRLAANRTRVKKRKREREIGREGEQ